MRDWQAPTDEDLQRQLTEPDARTSAADATEPRARTARYDKRSGRVVIELTNGCAFAFPAALGQGLADTTADPLAAVGVMPGGFGLHWEELDADLAAREGSSWRAKGARTTADRPLLLPSGAVAGKVWTSAGRRPRRRLGELAAFNGRGTLRCVRGRSRYGPGTGGHVGLIASVHSEPPCRATNWASSARSEEGTSWARDVTDERRLDRRSGLAMLAGLI